MTKQFVSILEGYAVPQYGVAEVKFIGKRTSNGKRLGVGELECGTPFLFRCKDGNIGSNNDANYYASASIPLPFPGEDKREYAAQLRELADWLETQ